MVIDLTPDTFFDYIDVEGVLNVVMMYGNTCGPCKLTMPVYESVAHHFQLHRVPNIRFFRMHFWEPSYKEFFKEHGIGTKGVPTFKFYFYGDVMTEYARSFGDPNALKQEILDVMVAIEKSIPEVFGHATR